MFKKNLLILLVLALSACSSEPKEPTAEADKTQVVEEIKETESDLTAEDIINEFIDSGLPIGKVVVQTAETDPNNKLGRPGEYISSAQFEDTRVRQPEPIPEIDLDEPDLPVGGVIEVFENEDDLNSRKSYIEQVYEMMPATKQYMYVSGLGLLRLEYELTPEQAAEYEKVFNSIY